MGERKKGKGVSFFKTQALFSSPQESLTKIKACLVDNKKHIRFGEWNSNDVSSITYLSLAFVAHIMFLVASSRKTYLTATSEDHSDFNKFNKLFF